VSCPSTPAASGPSVWRCSYDDALKPVETVTEVSDNGPYRIGRGWLAAIAVHEAAHAVALVSMGKPLEQIEFGLNFERDYDGKTLALPRGRCKLRGCERDGIDISPASVQLPQSRKQLEYCWRAFWGSAVVTCAGPAAEMKFCEQGGLPRGHVGYTDAKPNEWTNRLVWTTAARDGAAFQRLVWRDACRLMDVPLIWSAVQAVEAELFSGLLKLEPMDPRPGDSIKFVMPGEQAEALMVRAGIQLPHFLARHQCGPECIRGTRKISRRWARYLIEWEKESQEAAE
jgi:hypothetical protein